VIVQKLVEKGSEIQKLQIINSVSKYLASLGVHKNGTWAVQKIIDCAKTSAQIKTIIVALRNFVPSLLLDQFGNYVIQCCLRLGDHRNQFIFDAMSNRCSELGQGRFGARAMKACLESQYTTKTQQKQVSLAIIQHCVQLSTNANGSILITWLLDSSQVPGRYRVLAPMMQPHLNILCCHKLSSIAVLKISIFKLTAVNQKMELDAQDIIIKGIFHNASVLRQILQDQSVGVPMITKILANSFSNADQRQILVIIVKQELDNLKHDNTAPYKKLWDELTQTYPKVKIETSKDLVASHTEFLPKSFGSPIRPAFSQFVEEPLPPLYPPKEFSAHLPTPTQSPQYYSPSPYYANQYYSYGYNTHYYPDNQNDSKSGHQ
jgi:hypothetical protein